MSRSSLFLFAVRNLFSEGTEKNSHVFGKMSNVFRKISHVFWKNSDVFWESSEGSGKLMENSCRLWSILEVAKCDDSMKHPQTPSKGIEKSKTSFHRGGAKNGLYGWNLHGLYSKIASHKIFLHFFCRKSWRFQNLAVLLHRNRDARVTC